MARKIDKDNIDYRYTLREVLACTQDDFSLYLDLTPQYFALVETRKRNFSRNAAKKHDLLYDWITEAQTLPEPPPAAPNKKDLSQIGKLILRKNDCIIRANDLQFQLTEMELKFRQRTEALRCIHKMKQIPWGLKTMPTPNWLTQIELKNNKSLEKINLLQQAEMRMKIAMLQAEMNILEKVIGELQLSIGT